MRRKVLAQIVEEEDCRRALAEKIRFSCSFIVPIQAFTYQVVTGLLLMFSVQDSNRFIATTDFSDASFTTTFGLETSCSSTHHVVLDL